MKRIIIYPAWFIILSFVIPGLSACLKKDFDEPPDNGGHDPELQLTHSIAELKQLPTYVPIGDVTIAGVVVMADKSGNYFRKIVIQDSTGGIEVLIDQSYLYTDYPVGRKVYIKCKGLYLGAFADNPQLGYIPDATGFVSGIPALLAGNFIEKGSYPHTIIPDTFTISELRDVNGMRDKLNTLVAIKQVEFDTAAAGKPYADQAVVATSTERRLVDCIERSIPLKTSAYAAFQPYLTPLGNGTLTAVYTRFYNSPQLTLRDTNDVKFYGSRCSALVHTLLQERFSGQTEGAVIAIDSWTHFAETGDKFFRKGGVDQDTYARISAFGGGTPAVVKTWLITPEIDLTGKHNVKLSFKTKDGYDNGATLKVFVSTNYGGSGNPATAYWMQIPAVISSGNTTGFAPDWTVTYTSLSYSAPIHIAFRYDGGTGKTTTFDLTDIKVTSE